MFTCLLIASTMAQTSKKEEWVGQLQYGEVNVPFTFTIEYINAGLVNLTIINGEERIVINQLEKTGDSLFIPLQPFDAFMKVKFGADKIKGVWEKPYRNLKVAINATKKKERISVISSNPVSVGNRWLVTFKPGTSDAYPGIVLLDQKGSKVTGTIMTEVGDFRYFEGVVDGDSIKMSSFDGAHGFYLVGNKTASGWTGKFYFDPSYSEVWIATADDVTELKDPFEMISMQGNNFVPYYDILAAGNGRNAINTSQFEGRVVVIQVFGTWCPNSLDETNFLKQWYETKPEGVDLIAVTFEPNYSKEYGMRRIGEYRDHLSLPYEVYLGGQMSKSHAAIAFPFMDKIAAFPTLLLVDKKGDVRYIHSYFNGPATGPYYEAFKTQFDERINGLLNE
jgi:thiol-disulfide isomerase/thioredoxin